MEPYNSRVWHADAGEPVSILIDKPVTPTRNVMSEMSQTVGSSSGAGLCHSCLRRSSAPIALQGVRMGNFVTDKVLYFCSALPITTRITTRSNCIYRYSIRHRYAGDPLISRVRSHVHPLAHPNPPVQSPKHPDQLTVGRMMYSRYLQPSLLIRTYALCFSFLPLTSVPLRFG